MGRVAKKALVRTTVDVARGDRVEVSEEGIRPWQGRVLSVKWSSESGWWVDVQRDGEEGGTWAVADRCVLVVAKAGE